MCGQRLDQGASALRQYIATTPDEDQPPLGQRIGGWDKFWRNGDVAGSAASEYAACR